MNKSMEGLKRGILLSEFIKRFLMDRRIRKKRKKKNFHSDENKSAIISCSIFRSRGTLSNPLTKISSFKGR